jgi:hypothetical protein
MCRLPCCSLSAMMGGVDASRWPSEDGAERWEGVSGAQAESYTVCGLSEGVRWVKSNDCEGFVWI